MSFTSQGPVLPPLGATGLKLRGVHLLGASFDFAYDAAQLCVSLQPGSAGAALELRVVATGQRLPLAVEPTCIGVQPVEVAGVGFV